MGLVQVRFNSRGRRDHGPEPGKQHLQPGYGAGLQEIPGFHFHRATGWRSGLRLSGRRGPGRGAVAVL